MNENIVDAVKVLNTKERIVEELHKNDYDYHNIDLTDDEELSIEFNNPEIEIKNNCIIYGSNSHKGSYFTLGSIKDFKSLLFDLGYYICNANNIAMQNIITETGIIIKEYYFDENKEYIILEMTFTDRISIGVRYFLKTNSLLNAIKNVYNSYDNIKLSNFQYSRFMDYNTDDFIKFED